MVEIELAAKLWPVFMAVIVGVAWFIRLEAKVLSTEEKRKSGEDYLRASLLSEANELRNRQQAESRELRNRQDALDFEINKLEEKMWARFDAIHTMFSEISTKLTRVETIIDERTKDGHL